MLIFIYFIPIVLVAFTILTRMNMSKLSSIHKTVLEEFNDSGSIPSALKRLERLSGYYFLWFLIPTGVILPVLIVFLISLIVNIMAKHVGDEFYSNLGIISGLVSVVFYIYPSLTISDLVFDKTRNILRKTEEITSVTTTTMLKELVDKSKSLLWRTFLFSSTFGLVFYSLSRFELNIWMWISIPLFTLAVAVIVVEYIYPWWNSRSPTPIPLSHEHLRHTINECLAQQNASEIVIFEFASKKNKYANAFADGMFKKKIYFSDYFLHELTCEEVKAILVHEICHLKNYHLFVQMLMLIMPIPVGLFAVQITYSVVAAIEIMGFHLTSPLYFTVILIFLILIIPICYLTFYLNLLKLHERHADEYVIKSGINPDVLISALTKLHNLNDEPKSLSKLEEKFSTHPSLENRIKYINEFAKSMVK